MKESKKAIVSAPDTAFPNIGYAGTLAKSFSPKVISELASSGSSNTLTGILAETQALDSVSLNESLSSFFDSLYHHLLIDYRNEYVYKNAITQKLLLNKHSLKQSNIFSEFRVSASKADIMIVNGTSHIYEIKTDLDNFDRLNKQLVDYQHFSEFVSVVTSKEQASLIQDMVSPEIGILTLSSGSRLCTLRTAQSGFDNGILLHDTIFDSLRRHEYTEILSQELGETPILPNALIHSEYRKLFRKLDIVTAHKAAIQVLKNRTDLASRIKQIHSFPMSLKLAATTMDFNREEEFTLLNCLQRKTKDSLALSG